MDALEAILWVAFGCGCACLLMAGLFGWVLWHHWLRPRPTERSRTHGSKNP